MKNILYICNHCEKKHTSEDDIITLSSKSDDGTSKLNYKNSKANKYQLSSLQHFDDLHFCDSTCFSNFFFSRKHE